MASIRALVGKESHDARLLCSIWQRAFELLGFAVTDTLCKSKFCPWIFLLRVQLGYLLIKLSFLFFQLRHSVVDVCLRRECPLPAAGYLRR